MIDNDRNQNKLLLLYFPNIPTFGSGVCFSVRFLLQQFFSLEIIHDFNKHGSKQIEINCLKNEFQNPCLNNGFDVNINNVCDKYRKPFS